MKKKISVKTLYLLLVISIGLIGLGVGSTYALFVATIEIDNPITIVSNLSYDANILDIIEINLEPNETNISTLNIINITDNNLNYTAWYIDGGNDIVAGINYGSPIGSLAADGETFIEVEVRNESKNNVKVTLGVSSSSENVVIANTMKVIPNEKISSTMAARESWYTSSVEKRAITKITFAENYTVTGNETESWPAGVDKNNDGTNDNDIMCYLNGTEITIVGTNRIFANTDSDLLFEGFSSVTSIDNLNLLDTSKTTTMMAMFSACINLTSLDLSNFNTSKVGNMKYMFKQCSSLTSLDLSSFDTSNVIDMYGMFIKSSNLSTIYVSSSWNTSNVTSSSVMFNNCTSLTGGAGTKYNVNYTDATYAKIDGGTESPGYFTQKTV